MIFQVNVSQNGRGGTVFYTENDAKLSFDWEFSISGATVFVPNETEWMEFCKARNFSDGIERRDEILDNLGKELCRQKTSSGTFEIYGNFLEITF
ncbi:MAG TPA: hypothetical protein PKY59_00620 [Pyrinomonadaceae bacterium]|nr:hypothetical protein [Pyrinomonadaceae bacterium]